MCVSCLLVHAGGFPGYRLKPYLHVVFSVLYGCSATTSVLSIGNLALQTVIGKDSLFVETCLVIFKLSLKTGEIVRLVQVNLLKLMCFVLKLGFDARILDTNHVFA